MRWCSRAVAVASRTRKMIKKCFWKRKKNATKWYIRFCIYVLSIAGAL